MQVLTPRNPHSTRFTILGQAAAIVGLMLGLASCGGGGGGSVAPTTTATYTVSGTVSGFSGTGLILQNNGADDKSITTNGVFAFATPIASGANYIVTVKTQPTSTPLTSCTVNYGSGTIAGTNISNVSVVCSPAVFFNTSQAASVVIGQANFAASGVNQAGTMAAANTINLPYGNPTVNAGKLYLPDSTNNRTLVYNSIPLTNNASADFAIGQLNLSSAASGVGATTVSGPQQNVIYGNKLLVAEYGNNRISIYNTVPSSSPGTIDVVVGQADSISSAPACGRGGLNAPETVAMAGGKLVVADTGNSRVLIWSKIPTLSGTPPDLVLGQGSFNICSPNRGGVADANTFSRPAGVWSDGTRLVVADSNNNRVLIWNSIPTINGQPADLVLGQPDFFSSTANPGGVALPTTMNFPYDGVYFNNTQLFVADSQNNRVLVWNSFPTASGKAADLVLGQPDFATVATGTSSAKMSAPGGIFLYGKQLIVGDTGNNRYLIFNGM
jgi:hypothetical protein